MSSAPAKPADLVTVNIDGKDIVVPKGTNVIEAARLVGVEIPHYCYHPKLTIVGNCRMCLIEMGMPAVDPATKAPVLDAATGKPKINWIPRPQIGCGTYASPGLHIRTDSPTSFSRRNRSSRPVGIAGAARRSAVVSVAARTASSNEPADVVSGSAYVV